MTVRSATVAVIKSYVGLLLPTHVYVNCVVDAAQMQQRRVATSASAASTAGGETRSPYFFHRVINIT